MSPRGCCLRERNGNTEQTLATERLHFYFASALLSEAAASTCRRPTTSPRGECGWPGRPRARWRRHPARARGHPKRASVPRHRSDCLLTSVHPPPARRLACFGAVCVLPPAAAAMGAFCGASEADGGGGGDGMPLWDAQRDDFGACFVAVAVQDGALLAALAVALLVLRAAQRVAVLVRTCLYTAPCSFGCSCLLYGGPHRVFVVVVRRRRHRRRYMRGVAEGRGATGVSTSSHLHSATGSLELARLARTSASRAIPALLCTVLHTQCFVTNAL